MPKTLFQKIWDLHVVTEQPDSPAVLYIDLHLVHEVTSPQAFDGLRQRRLKVRRPDKTFATVDHSFPTTPLDVPIADAMAAARSSKWKRTRLNSESHCMECTVRTVALST